jgi:Flp pilus assembly protein TadG
VTGARRRRLRSASRQRGNVAVIVALMLPVLIGVAALAVDVGNQIRVIAEVQNAADAAALAGAQALNGMTSGWSNAQTMAASAYVANKANGSTVSGTDLTVSGYVCNLATKPATCASSTDATQINGVGVSAQRTGGSAIATYLAGAMGYSSTSAIRSGIAVSGNPASACQFAIGLINCTGAGFTMPACPGDDGKVLDLVTHAGSEPYGIIAVANNNAEQTNFSNAYDGVCQTPVTTNSLATQSGNDINPADCSQLDYASHPNSVLAVPILTPATPATDCASWGSADKASLTVSGFLPVTVTNCQSKDVTVKVNCSNPTVAGSGPSSGTPTGARVVALVQ